MLSQAISFSSFQANLEHKIESLVRENNDLKAKLEILEKNNKELNEKVNKLEMSKVPVYRLLNSNGDHFYTTTEEEKNFALKHGYKFENIGFYAFK